MFRKMRRFKQALTEDQIVSILESQTSGVLAVTGDDGYPYAVPLSYVYLNNKLYFHCAKTGHKLDAIAKNNKASFCVIQQDQVIPQEFTTYYRSVIAFGKICLLENETEKRKALELLAAKYTPDDEPGRLQEIDKLFNQVCMLELTIEHVTGKEAKELLKTRNI